VSGTKSSRWSVSVDRPSGRPLPGSSGRASPCLGGLPGGGGAPRLHATVFVLALALAGAAAGACSTTEGASDGVDVVAPDWAGFGSGKDGHGTLPDAGHDSGPALPDGQVCVPFHRTCGDATTVQQCTADGDGWLESPCPEGKGCDAGECLDQVCTPGLSSGECLEGQNAYRACNDGGTAEVTVSCGAGSKCFKGICITTLCEPGQRVCKSPTSVQVCEQVDDPLSPTGKSERWADAEICPAGGICDGGKCLSPCDVNVKAGSYLGCEYWALDLDNVEESKDAPVGVVVSVPSDKAATTVTISSPTTGPLSAAVLGVPDLVVEPGQVEVFTLPQGYDVDGSVKTNRTFHIETTSPVAVHMFNPLNGDGVYTNDASLLLPSNVTGEHYVVMSWPHRSTGYTLRGFATIVATEPGVTQVKVVPSAPVAPGQGVSALSPGTPYLFTLAQGEALNLETDGADGVDLTGTTVDADQKITVIGGHECANVPLGISACDHLEQQLFPVETWSTEYVADAFAHRSATQVDIYRVVAGDNEVTVTTSPPVPGYETFKLQRGQWIQFASPSSFYIHADGPIMVGHYLTGANYPGAVKNPACEQSAVGEPEPLGDPAFTLAAPVKRYLREYAVLTPSGYMSGQNYLNIIARTGTAVTMDGAPVSAIFTPIIGSDFSVATVNVTPGVHTLKAGTPFGLTAYGYDCDVSYAYPGGLKLVGFGG